ncbi:MAG: hypothetical protein ACKO7P_06130 [Bacteroidota bacterium]
MNKIVNQFVVFMLMALRALLVILALVGCMYIIGKTFGYLNTLFFIVFLIVSVFLILNNFGSRKKKGDDITYNSKEFLTVSLLSIMIAVGIYALYELIIQGYTSSLLIIGIFALLVLMPGWAIAHFFFNRKDSVRLTPTSIHIQDNNTAHSFEFIDIKSLEVDTSSFTIFLNNETKHNFNLFELNLNQRDGVNIKKDIDVLLKTDQSNS